MGHAIADEEIETGFGISVCHIHIRRPPFPFPWGSHMCNVVPWNPIAYASCKVCWTRHSMTEVLMRHSRSGWSWSAANLGSGLTRSLAASGDSMNDSGSCDCFECCCGKWHQNGFEDFWRLHFRGGLAPNGRQQRRESKLRL